jgi:hypothetical protein
MFWRKKKAQPAGEVQGIEHCIQETGPNAHETIKAIIHRGIDGNGQFVDGDKLGSAQSSFSRRAESSRPDTDP